MITVFSSVQSGLFHSIKEPLRSAVADLNRFVLLLYESLNVGSCALITGPGFDRMHSHAVYLY